MNLVIRSIMKLLITASLFIGVVSFGISGAMIVPGSGVATIMSGVVFTALGILGIFALNGEKGNAPA